MVDQAPADGVMVTFAREVGHDIEAVKRAAYRFSDRIFVEITEVAGNQVCILRKLDPDGHLNLEILAGEFRNEVLDQDLRIKIAAETADYRNLILSLAFSKTPLAQ